MIQLQFAINRIKICPLKPEIEAAKCCATSLRCAYDGKNNICDNFYLF